MEYLFKIQLKTIISLYIFVMIKVVQTLRSAIKILSIPIAFRCYCKLVKGNQ